MDIGEQETLDLGSLVDICNPSTEVNGGGGQFQLHKSEGSLSYVKPCLKIEKEGRERRVSS